MAAETVSVVIRQSKETINRGIPLGASNILDEQGRLRKLNKSCCLQRANNVQHTILLFQTIISLAYETVIS